MSLAYSSNNKDPKIDPCGTPQSNFAIKEYLSLIFTRKLLFESYHLNQFTAGSENLRSDIFFQ